MAVLPVCELSKEDLEKEVIIRDRRRLMQLISPQNKGKYI